MPGTRCAVAICNNSLQNTKANNLKISYHKFPKNMKLRKMWVNACHRKDVWNPKTSVICSNHFYEEDFETDLRASLMNIKTRRILKPLAVPSKNCSKHESSSVTSRNERIEKRRTKELVQTLLAEMEVASSVNKLTSCCCFVPGCVNSEGNRTDATFYEFPEDLQEDWLMAIGRNRDTFIIDQLVCSEHFECSDFENDDKIKTLQPNALPTLNLPTEPEGSPSTCEDIEQNYNSHEKSQPVKISSNAICTVLKPRIDGTYECETTPLNTLNVVLVSEGSHEIREADSDDDHLKYEEIFNCRTCLGEIGEDGSVITEIHQDNKTLKDMIIYCIPQLASTLFDTDRVCDTCLESIKFCTNFIESCLKVESELLESQDEYIAESPDEVDGSKENAVPEIVKRISLDHNYVPEAEPEVKSDTSERAINCDAFVTKHDCLKCNRTFKTKNYLLDHVRRIHSAADKPETKKKLSTFECDFCDKSFLTKLGYDLHLQLSHRDLVEKKKESGGYTCRDCGGRFVTFSDLSEHKFNQHGYSCKFCSLRFDTRKELNVHAETHPHTELCHVCGKGFWNKANLKVHMLTHNDPNTLLCHQCGQGFKSQVSLNLHFKHHDPELKFRCDQCPSAFQQRYRLDMHRKVLHLGIREYKCAVCDKKFCYKANLQSHYRLKHSEVKPFQCERCGLRFARLDYLRRHTNCGEKSKRKGFASHKRKYRYKRGDPVLITCKLCSKVFKDVQMLRLHVKTHTKLRKYKCSACNLTFTTGANRDRHERVHKDALFRCEVCFKKMDTQEALDEHCAMSHENSKKYACHICGELFGRKYLLHSHVVEKHEDVEDFEKEKDVVYKVVMEDYLVD